MSRNLVKPLKNFDLNSYELGTNQTSFFMESMFEFGFSKLHMVVFQLLSLAPLALYLVDNEKSVILAMGEIIVFVFLHTLLALTDLLYNTIHHSIISFKRLVISNMGNIIVRL